MPLTGSAETLCLLERPQLRCCRLVQPCLMMPPPPHPPRHPLIHHFGPLGSVEPKSSTLTNFNRHITNFRVLGSAEPRIPRNANLRCARWR